MKKPKIKINSITSDDSVTTQEIDAAVSKLVGIIFKTEVKKEATNCYNPNTSHD